MKKSINIRSFFTGVVVTLLVLGLSVPALAVAGKTIEVFGGIKIYVDDVELHPVDSAGNPIDIFVYNGTTYLPVAAVSKALGKPVQWEGSTRSVYIGKHSSSTPAAYLSEMDYFFITGGKWEFDKMTKDNLGVDHMHSICLSSTYASGDITYKLNGQYSRLSGAFYLRYDYRGYQGPAANSIMIIYGDGRELWRGTVDRSINPIDIDIDITGVLELKLEHPKNSGSGCLGALGDMALWA